jgi:hypothetical protein
VAKYFKGFSLENLLDQASSLEIQLKHFPAGIAAHHLKNGAGVMKHCLQALYSHAD